MIPLPRLLPHCPLLSWKTLGVPGRSLAILAETVAQARRGKRRCILRCRDDSGSGGSSGSSSSSSSCSSSSTGSQ